MAQKSESGLEEVVKAGSLYNLANAASNPQIPYKDQVSAFKKYAEISQLNPALVGELGTNPGKLSEAAAEARRESEGLLVKAVEYNLEDVSLALSPEQVKQAVFIYHVSDEIKKIMNALEKQDVATLQKIYSRKVKKGKAIENVLLITSSSEDIISYASQDLQKAQSEFLVKLSDEAKKGDKAKYKYNPRKAAALVKQTAEKIKGDEKKRLYLTLGMFYMQNLQEAAAEKKKETKKAA